MVRERSHGATWGSTVYHDRHCQRARRGGRMPAEKMDEATGATYDKGLQAAVRLKRALEAHGVTFPSLSGTWPVNGTAMVQLGGCRADVAEALAVILEGTAAE